MDREQIRVGNVVELDDGRKVRISKVHEDYSFEWDLVPDAEVTEVKPEEIKDEKEESIEVEVKKEAPKKATAKRVIKKK